MSNRVLFILLLVLGTVGSVQSLQGGDQKGHSKVWKAGVFEGLVIGKSSREDVLRKMGKPSYAGPSVEAIDPSERVLEYDISQPVKGKARFYSKGPRKLLSGIVIEPESLAKNEAVKLFGKDFVVTRYSVDYCLSQGGSSPLYEDPHGETVQIEYRQQGLALAVKNGEVTEIIYTDSAFGPKKSRCKQKKEK